ncbi:MAG: serine hydrolase domain-containing protein [Balneolaceae bacterium]
MKLRYLKFNLTLLAFIIYMPLNAQPLTLESALKETQGYFITTLEENNIVGGALLFLEDGDVKSTEYYGMADLSENRAVDENTIFHWASNTKTITAVAIMQLRDRGLLSLHDPLTKYLPELRKIHNPFGSMDEITIKMALEHSTGLRNPTWPWGGRKEWHPFEPTDWEQLVAMFPYSKIEFEPGTKHSYSNPAIIFLGRIIEELSGDDFEVYIDKNILKPLKMYDSYFDITPAHLLSQRSNSYSLQDGEPVAKGKDFDSGITTSNGGLNASLKDMVNYLSFLTGNSPGFEILKRSSLEELWEEQLPIEEKDGIRSSVALSFFLEEFDGMRVIGHTGTQHGYYSFFYVHPESGTACIAITNTEGQNNEPNLDEIRSNLSRYIFKNLFALYK